jgi:MFS transporter, FHS family, glucose/mannose:H+ symporter
MQNLRIKTSLYLNFLFFAIMMSSDGILILQVQKHYGVAASVAGLLGGFRDMSVAVAALLLAAYVARIGYKRSMLIALAMVALICLLVPVGNSFTMIEMLFLVTGVAFALMKSSIFSAIGLLAHNIRAHATFMSYLEAMYAAGTFAGYFIFSAYSDDRRGSTDWLLVYYIMAGVSVLAMLALWWAPLDESEVQDVQPQPLLSDLTAMFKLATTAVAGAFVACVFTYDLLAEGINKWLPTFNNEVLHVPVALSIQLASIMAASAVLGRVLGGLALRFASWLTVLLTCLALSALLVLVTLPLAERGGMPPVTSWRSAPLAAFVFPLIGMVTAPIYPVMNSRVLSGLPARQQGAMAGLIMLSSALGATVGSFITGSIFQAYGGTMAFYWSLVPIALLAGSLLLLNALEKRAAAIAPELRSA